MTCDEFRQKVVRKPEEFTRGERASIVAHYGQCDACEEWWEKNSQSIPAMTEEEAERDRRLHAADFADPEYLATVFGKPK